MGCEMTPLKTLAQARKAHVEPSVAQHRIPVHFEKTAKGFRQTDRAHCAICPPKGGGQ